jgi:uncharacterized phage protein gp47/JayE
MSSYGVLPTGFSGKSIQEILDEIEADLRAAFGEEFVTASDSVAGQLNGTFGGQAADLWEVLQATYSSLDPDKAIGAALDALSALTGAARLPATRSTVPLALNLAAGSQLLPGRITSDLIGNRYVTTELIENPNAYADIVAGEAESEEYGPISTLAGQIVNIETPVGGWSEAAAVKNGSAEPYVLSDGQTLLVKVDGGSIQTATFNTGDFVDIGAATAAEVAAVLNTDITGQAANDAGGYVRAASDNADGETSTIEVTGGTATALNFPSGEYRGMNPTSDSEPGRDLETDAELRLRREQLLRAQGAGTVEAILADILSIDGVDDARVFENPTDSIDGDGRDPHSVEVIILGANPDTELDEAVAQQIFDSKAAGIQTYRVAGSAGRTVTIEDSQGVNHDINFNRAAEVDIYIEIDVNVVADDYSGDDALKAALVAEGDLLTIGEDVILERIKCAAFDVDGVHDVTDFKIDIVSPPTGTSNISIPTRSIAAFDTSQVTVSSTPVIPT